MDDRPANPTNTGPSTRYVRSPGIESDRPKWKLDDLDVAVDLWLISTGSDPAGRVAWVAHYATKLQDQTNRRTNRGEVDEVEILAELMEPFDAHALPALDRWANPGLLANDLEDLEVPFAHGELLLGLDRPNGTERQTTIRRLRGGTLSAADDKPMTRARSGRLDHGRKLR